MAHRGNTNDRGKAVERILIEALALEITLTRSRNPCATGSVKKATKRAGYADHVPGNGSGGVRMNACNYSKSAITNRARDTIPAPHLLFLSTPFPCDTRSIL